MKPRAYISDGGVLFKESPPDSILSLSPLYTSAEIQALHNLVKEQEKRIIDLAFDLEYRRWKNELRKLNDEEIQEVWESKKFCGDLYVDYVAFARAILQKAEEE